MRHLKYVVVKENNKQKDYNLKLIDKYFNFGNLYMEVCNSSQS